MQNATVWRALLGVEKTVVDGVEFDEDDRVLVAHVRPARRSASRCGRCRRRSPWYDRGEARRRWRTLDLGTISVWLEADAPRVDCPDHGPTVRAAPWARHAAGHTTMFDEQVAWLATQCSKTAVTELMRIAWRTVGAIVARVWADVEKLHDRFDGLRRLGIDEISYKRGHKYLTVVVDHDSGRLVWAAPGRDKATLAAFFDALGPKRCARITHVSADGADWISSVVEQRCPIAVRCADPFHIVRWATDALDEVRRDAWNAAPGAVTQRRTGRATGHAKALKRGRYALWKNPGNLTDRQRAKLNWIARTDPRLYRAYLLKEGLRLVFQLGHAEAADALEQWIGWARRCRIPAFVELQRRIVKHQASILAAIKHGLSNGRIDQHQDQTHHPDRVRIPITPRPHRPRRAHPQRPPTSPPRPKMTHGSVSRAKYRFRPIDFDSMTIRRPRGQPRCAFRNRVLRLLVKQPWPHSEPPLPSRPVLRAGYPDNNQTLQVHMHGLGIKLSNDQNLWMVLGPVT